MYENVVGQIHTIVAYIKENRGMDLTALPLSEIMEITAVARKQMEGDREDPCEPLLTLLDRMIRADDIGGVCAALEMIAVCLNDVDHILARNELVLYYRNIVTHRMPEYHYMKNSEKIRKYYETHVPNVRTPFTGKGVVYTVVTGDYDVIDRPLVVDDEWDYIVFTDRGTLSADGWRIRLINDTEEMGYARLSRKPKLLCHKYLEQYDYSIYIDGNMQITGDLREYIRKYSTGESMLCMNHYINRDVYEEAELCKENKRDKEEVIDAQMERYRREGFPEDYGLTTNNFLIRDHRDEKLRKVMEDWWEELCRGSVRDQLSFTYCCWKNDFIYDTSPLFVSDNSYIRTKKHGH